jgi:hypothetical protein
MAEGRINCRRVENYFGSSVISVKHTRCSSITYPSE